MFVSQARQRRNAMDDTDQRVAEKFAAFENEQDPTRAYEAIEIVEAAVRDVPASDPADCRQAVSYWLHFLGALDQNIDPMWNVNDLPVKGAAPPPSEGVVYASGEVEPLTISDPAARAEYERALKASKRYDSWYRAQFQLRRIEQRAMRFVARLLSERYNLSDEDRQEFDKLLAASPVNDDRKNRLRALLN
jgi:hypothetical protein